MHPLDPLLIQSFPAPPSHIPATPTSPNPPPSLPPSAPLPPVPGPSRISGHESLLLLSTASRSRRSERLSLATDTSDPPRSFRASYASSPPHSPAATNPHQIAFSISEEGVLWDDVPPRRPAHHAANDSISSIDMRDILNATLDDDDNDAAPTPMPRPTPKPSRTLSLADPIDPHTIPPSPGPISRSFTFPTRKTLFQPARDTPSPDIGAIISNTPRPVLRSRKSSSASLAKRADSPPPPLPTSELPYVTRYGDSPFGDDARLDLRHHMDVEPDDDDDTRSWIDHDEYGKPIAVALPGRKHKKPNNVDRWTSLERQLEGTDGSESDSSLDLHTPLPHLMVRHGLLSPRSKLVASLHPLAGRDSVVSLASTTSTTTLAGKGLAKDSRDTLTRRTRHRDGRLLKGGIGLTTGLGWSDSEDEDAPSALTRRLSALNLSRRSSAASLGMLSRSTSHMSLGSAFKERDSTSTAYLSRSYSSRTLPDEDVPDPDEWGTQRRSKRGVPADSSKGAPMGDAAGKGKGRWSSHSLPSSKHTSSLAGGPPTAWDAKRSLGGGGGTASARTSVASSRSASSSLRDVGRRSGSIPEGEEGPATTGSSGSTTGSSSGLLLTPTDGDGYMDVDELGLGGGGVRVGGAQLKREKSLPPLPPALRRSPASLSKSTTTLPPTTTTTQKRGFGFAGGGDQRLRTASSSTMLRARASTDAVRATITPSSSLSTSAMNMKSTPAPTPRPLRLGAPSMPAPSSPLPSPSHLPGRDRPAVPVPGVPPPTSASGVAYRQRPVTPNSNNLSVNAYNGPGTGERPKPRTGTGMVYRNSAAGVRMRAPSTGASAALGLGAGAGVGGMGLVRPPPSARVRPTTPNRPIAL
ncbi:hypothetical protein DXG03_005204 [Asterophora parasitica]|uniref:Uncharacterized protein n=1 Tax=Asterophora parasitica TaxID=117018 RepID=A0A9P7GET3_9AGAR|nr:hypothetical protein DXG03_005204 [Asterophora parasitica]